MKLLIYRNYYLAICISTVFICLAPLFIPELEPRILAISQTGSLGYILRNSVTIKVMAGICIGTTLPVMVDIFLDKFSNISFFDLTNTCVVLLVIILSGTMYLSLNDQYYMAYLYVSFFYAVMITTTAAVLFSISKGVIATQCKVSPLLFLCPIISIAATSIFVALTMIFPEIGALNVVLGIIRVLGGVSFVIMHGRWFFSLWRHYRTQKQFGVDETKEITYMVGELFFFVCHASLSIKRSNFLNADESFFIMYYIIIILFSVFMTVLPGRLLRKMSEIKESVLRLKREFVRYVSHEIRSPLNVAHAGLEILKADLEAMGASLAILSLLDDIFSASNSAIEILNDMLHYEHMDSGTFKLELAVTPLLNVFAGRLEVYKYMALKKNINLLIEDQAQASEYCANGGADVALDVDGEETRSRNMDTDADTSLLSVPVLYIDRFRVEQVIRNLMSNAIKFTPEGGSITMRITRVAAVSTTSPTVSRPFPQVETNPIDQLDDSSLDKTLAGFLRFEVVDSGAGIALENQSRMFNEFMQFNRNTLQGGGGSGLGLWICKNLATLHGGRLGFHSDGEGMGSTFAVELPIYSKNMGNQFAADMISSSVASIPLRVKPRSPVRHVALDRVVPFENVTDAVVLVEHSRVYDIRGVAETLSILIVDDSSANRKIVHRMLESSANKPVLGDCVSILEADDGYTALDVVRTETAADRAIDFVLMDYVMIRMNGPEAAQKMRADLGYCGVVIGITGNALPEDLDNFRDHGANVVLTKPLTNAKLMDAMKQSRFEQRMNMVV